MFEPNETQSPLASTTFSASTASRAAPYLTARVPEALLAISPPMVATTPEAGVGG
ncbi:MAG: hypothetical protein BWY57_02500 [Betaproteobacteria bacterium ADurb.Bin341]|nr:MAG: hypothetical protein BWY57_02500 [Betaproteobacteria bacterium ADurb.Bin341]